MNTNQQQQQPYQHNMEAGPGSGLTRYRSAPSSYFESLLETPANDSVFGGDDFDHLFNPRARASSPETQRILTRFMTGTDGFRENSSLANARLSSQLPPLVKAEPPQPLQRQQSNDYSSASQVMYRGPYPNSGSFSGGLDNSFGGNQLKVESSAAAVGRSSSLVRHSSSPAGLFASIDIKNEFGTMRATESFIADDSSTKRANAEASSSSRTRFRHQMDFSMNTIPEIDLKGMAENSVQNQHFSQEHGNNNVDYITGLPMGSWDDSDTFLLGLPDNESKRFLSANVSDDQNNDGGNRPVTHLSHHLSLPTSSAELSAMEKMLQDSVPCKMRAKRGFATHPRSIAERVRRSKISERIRKLQELVPNMEKQTNTSDMLDLAVEYIKDLQRQVKSLRDSRARCSCSAKQNL